MEQSIDKLQEFSTIDPLWTNLIEDCATVTKAILPDELGRVKFQGTRWRASSDRVVSAGTRVRVVGRQRTNILVVEPVGTAAVCVP